MARRGSSREIQWVDGAQVVEARRMLRDFRAHLEVCDLCRTVTEQMLPPTRLCSEGRVRMAAFGGRFTQRELLMADATIATEDC
jgi:hypothetical protein